MHFTSPVIIGLEIHIELNTKSKLFCSCATHGNEEPNTRTCEICLGMPGSKPKVNKKAIEYSLSLALALKCKIAPEILFSRKSYFYPDMSKNYQITQYEHPLGKNGYLTIENKKVGITRVHLEEDPASLIHPGGIQNSKLTLIDYNRSGNPLCEIVTEPEIYSPAEAHEFLKQLVNILVYLGIFDQKKNIIKADANISIKETGYVRAEIKNISSFKEIVKALEYEFTRQKHAAEEGIKLKPETRAWLSDKGITESLRSKETEEDYGYITDPDLVPLEISEEFLKSISSNMPELPFEKMLRYVKELNISTDDAFVISSEFILAAIFEKVIKKVNPVLAAKWIRRELVRVANYNNIELIDLKINADPFSEILSLVEKGNITEKTGQRLVEKLVVEDFDVIQYVNTQNLLVIKDTGEIEKYCLEAISENPKAAADFKSGNANSVNFFVGQVMRKTKGKADPKELHEILTGLLK
ncbi:MAG: Asp-tRNA(Asn)/Glu-tRNA(Gln) amidotransferase subunit GatB [archaeon]